jgi:hypothetical protein
MMAAIGSIKKIENRFWFEASDLFLSQVKVQVKVTNL